MTRRSRPPWTWLVEYIGQFDSQPLGLGGCDCQWQGPSGDLGRDERARSIVAEHVLAGWWNPSGHTDDRAMSLSRANQARCAGLGTHRHPQLANASDAEYEQALVAR